MKTRGALVLLLAMILVARRPRAGEVPPDRQSLLILRAIAYDHNFKPKGGDPVNVLIIYHEGDQPSESMKTDMVGAFEETAKSATVLGHPVRVTAVPFTGSAGLEAKVADTQAAIIYLCTGLADAVKAVTAVTRARALLSATGVEAYLADGVAVAFISRTSKTTIVINLAASQAEGHEWDPLLLRLAEIRR